ncbi:MAG: hypothetical protein AVDCRST_MAG08-1691, partial [uncultured Acetobacteraceae bacterium]
GRRALGGAGLARRRAHGRPGGRGRIRRHAHRRHRLPPSVAAASRRLPRRHRRRAVGHGLPRAGRLALRPARTGGLRRRGRLDPRPCVRRHGVRRARGRRRRRALRQPVPARARHRPFAVPDRIRRRLRGGGVVAPARRLRRRPSRRRRPAPAAHPLRADGGCRARRHHPGRRVQAHGLGPPRVQHLRGVAERRGHLRDAAAALRRHGDQRARVLQHPRPQPRDRLPDRRLVRAGLGRERAHRAPPVRPDRRLGEAGGTRPAGGAARPEHLGHVARRFGHPGPAGVRDVRAGQVPDRHRGGVPADHAPRVPAGGLQALL